MSCKTSIDDIQQSAQTIEGEYDIHAANRVLELQQRYEKEDSNNTESLPFLLSLVIIDGNIQSRRFHNESNSYKIQWRIPIMISIPVQWNTPGSVQ